MGWIMIKVSPSDIFKQVVRLHTAYSGTLCIINWVDAYLITCILYLYFEPAQLPFFAKFICNGASGYDARLNHGNSQVLYIPRGVPMWIS